MTADATVPPLDWIVLVDLRDDIMQDDLHFRFPDLHSAEQAVASWMREGHVARMTLDGLGPDAHEIHDIFPLAGVKKFEIRFQPLPQR